MAKKLTDAERKKAASLRNLKVAKEGQLKEARENNPSLVNALLESLNNIKEQLEKLTGKKEE